MESTICKLCSCSDDFATSRLYDGGRACSKCRRRVTSKCLVKGCKTPARKQKLLKNIPARVSELAPAARLQLNLEYGLTLETTEYCSSCNQKLHRSASAVPYRPSTQAMPQQPPWELPKPGRPPTPYDKASNSTQKKVEKAAKELHLSTAEDLTKKLDEMSQGSGKVLYEKVVGP